MGRREQMIRVSLGQESLRREEEMGADEEKVLWQIQFVLTQWGLEAVLKGK